MDYINLQCSWWGSYYFNDQLIETVDIFFDEFEIKADLDTKQRPDIEQKLLLGCTRYHDRQYSQIKKINCSIDQVKAMKVFARTFKYYSNEDKSEDSLRRKDVEIKVDISCELKSKRTYQLRVTRQKNCFMATIESQNYEEFPCMTKKNVLEGLTIEELNHSLDIVQQEINSFHKKIEKAGRSGQTGLFDQLCSQLEQLLHERKQLNKAIKHKNKNKCILF